MSDDNNLGVNTFYNYSIYTINGLHFNSPSIKGVYNRWKPLALDICPPLT